MHGSGAGPAGIQDFSRRVFSSLTRADQRRWAEAYLRGLLETPGRKSLRNIAAHGGLESGVPALQQFLNQSPWGWDPVRRSVTRLLEAAAPAPAWAVERVVIPKRGEHSVGVQRRFIPSAGRSVNCQVGLALHLLYPGHGLAVNWRLVLPRKWLEYPEWRGRARIPAHVDDRGETELALDMVRQLCTEWGLQRRPVLVNAVSEPNPAVLVDALSRDGFDFVVKVPPAFGAIAGAHLQLVRGERSTWSPEARMISVRGGFDDLRRVALSDSARMRKLLMRLPPTRAGGDVSLVRVVSDGPVAGTDDGFWITNLVHRPVAELERLIRWKDHLEHGVTTRVDPHGMRDFEGRSFQGWHHHMTVVSAAHTARFLGFDQDRRRDLEQA